MTLADQTAITGHDGQVTEGQPARPKRRTGWRTDETGNPRTGLAGAVMPAVSPDFLPRLLHDGTATVDGLTWTGEQEELIPGPRSRCWPGGGLLQGRFLLSLGHGARLRWSSGSSRSAG